MQKNIMGVVYLIGLLAVAGPAAAQDVPAANPGGQAQKSAASAQAQAEAAKPAAREPAAAPVSAKEPAAAPSGGQKAGKASHPMQGSPAVVATEKRYQDYLDKEKAASDATLVRQRGRLEDKYKGFVRTVKPRQGSKGDAIKGGQ